MPDEQPDATDQPRWIDAFPWLEAAAASSGHTATGASAWWLEPVDASGAQRRERLADLSDLALECLTRWTIGQIFPALPAWTALTLLPMTNRAKNALSRFGYRNTGDLQALELSDLLDLPNIGVGTVDSILQALGDASTLEAAPTLPLAPAGSPGLGESPSDHNGELAGRAQPIIEDLQTLASWYATLGLPDRALMGEGVPPCSPPEVIKARQRLELAAACDVLSPEQAALDAADLLQRSVTALDERVRRVLACRLFADRPLTLDELGQDLGLTRERVRQIEAKARAEMVAELEPGKPLGAVSAAIRELVGVVLPLADLLSLVPALARLVEGTEQPAWRVLDRLDDSFEIKDGWCAVPTVLSAQTETMTRVQEVANRHGVARLSDLVLRSPNQPSGLAPASSAEWLQYCDCHVDGDHVFTRLQSVGDRAAAILSVASAPMSAQDILSCFDVERSLPSLRNAMGSDDRFARVDRDKWALAEWGLASYSGIRAVVRDEVARESGRIPMETLIERITGRYSVTASSVIAYASAPPFETRDGVVRFAAGDRDVHKGPERTRRLYRGSNGWLYRVAVTKDHLRGSGSPAPVAVAAILGLQPGQTCELASALGPQTVNWTGNQPAFGTIRRFLIDSDIETGSEIFLVIGDNRTFRIEPVGTGGASALNQALRLTGATSVAARQQPRTALAAAIGLPEDSPAASVIGGYRERGDSDIADLLLSARDQLEGAAVNSRPEQSTDIDDILELL